MPMQVDFKQLQVAVDWSMTQLEEPRRNRVTAIKEFVGKHYASDGADKVVPTNFLELAATIYLRQLAARAPRVLVTTHTRSLRPFAMDMQIALNDIPAEIKLGRTLRRAVMEAMFGLGVVKVGIADSGVAVLGHDVGESFVDLVTLDDYFVDMSAKQDRTIQFQGNDYWLPVASARALMQEGHSVEPDAHTVSGVGGIERAEGVSESEGADLYKEKVWLRDVWLPAESQVVTYGVQSKKLYSIIDWDGPENGPYYVLGFTDVPGNLLPLPPVALWRDLHELGNNLFRKLAQQAEVKKTVTAFAGGNEADVEAYRRAADGDGIKYSGPKPETLSSGGIDPATLAFYLQNRDLFSYFAGNLDTLGGLSPQADTLGQEKLLGEASSARVGDMRDQTNEFAGDIFKALAWYEWTNPVRERVIQKPIKGTDLSIRKVWSAETREGNYLDFNLDIDVYSMQDNSPSTILQKLGTILERFVFPVLPMIEQQGGQIDFEKLMEMIGQLSDMPELNELVVFGEPPEGEPARGGDSKPAAMPANTTRTYERVNRPGATRAGKDDVLTRSLMGVGVQDSEMAAVGRPTS